jgi:Sugar (and other) transporter
MVVSSEHRGSPEYAVEHGGGSLISRKDRAAAIRALVFYRGGSAAESEHLVEEILVEARQTARIDLPVLAAVKEVLHQPHLRRAMTIGIVGLQLLVGSWAIILVSTVILEAHFNASGAQLASLAFSTANLIASVIGMNVVEKFGRRPMLLISHDGRAHSWREAPDQRLPPLLGG